MPTEAILQKIFWISKLLIEFGSQFMVMSFSFQFHWNDFSVEDIQES